MLRVLELSDAASFVDQSMRFLLEHEAENNLLVSSALTLAKTAARAPKFAFYVVEQGGKIVAAALNSPDRRLLLSICNEQPARFLGEELRRRLARVKAVLGPSQSAQCFGEAYCGGRELNELHLNRHQRILRLEKLEARQTSHGHMRVALAKDSQQLLTWSRQFALESGFDETMEQTEILVQRYLDGRQFFVWDDGRVVAMAGYSGNTPNGIRISMVFTDKLSRGKGYAGSLVYVLTRRLLSDGHRFCFLFTESGNPVANHIYEKMGYRSVCEFSEYGFNVKITG